MADTLDHEREMTGVRAPREPLARALLATTALVALLSCEGLHVVQPGSTAEVRVTPDTIILRIGDSAIVRAAPIDASKTLLAQRVPEWSSSSAAVATVDPDGIVRALGAGVVAIRAVVGAIEGQAVAIVSGEPAAAGAAAGNAQVAGVNGSVAIDPSVRITDAQGNGVYGVPVTFAVTGGGGAVIGEQPVLTDVDGLAPIQWRLGPTPGANAMVATAAGAGLTGNPVGFSATAEVGPPDAEASSIEALPATIPPSAGASVSTITVTVRDALGRTVAGAAVTLSATGAGNTLTQPAAVTDLAGRATGTLSSTVAEEKVVSASMNGTLLLSHTATVMVNPGAPAAIAVVAQPDGAVSNAQFLTQPVVEFRDGFGNRLMTATDAVTVTLAHGDGLLGSGSGSFTVSAVAGRATFAGLYVRGIRATGDTLGTGQHVLEFTVPGLAPVESDTVDVEVSYAYNVVDVFQRGCANCHAYTVANMVNQLSVGPCAARVRVVPGDSTSLMYEKMKAAPSCGSAMPFGPLMSPRQRAIVRDWIVQGARDN